MHRRSCQGPVRSITNTRGYLLQSAMLFMVFVYMRVLVHTSYEGSIPNCNRVSVVPIVACLRMCIHLIIRFASGVYYNIYTVLLLASLAVCQNINNWVVLQHAVFTMCQQTDEVSRNMKRMLPSRNQLRLLVPFTNQPAG